LKIRTVRTARITMKMAVTTVAERVICLVVGFFVTIFVNLTNWEDLDNLWLRDNV